ncbi:hypothetical protein AAF712_015068 [Marasmius tenuissimus]|uniref:Uncharacterized protein n=1 Tax=Marasmius tenuissimus TaxID=585030 RepID=A0ABR2Z9B3_9AGAR
MASDCFHGVDTVLMATNLPQLLYSMTEALRILLRNRKYLSSRAMDGKEWWRTYSLTTKVVIYISNRISTSVHAQNVLDCGMIEVLFFSDERFHELENMDGEDWTDRSKLSEEIVRLLSSMSVFLVHGPVVRSFARGSRKFPRSEIVAERSSNRQDTSNKAWRDVLSKRSIMNEMRHGVEKLLGSCSNPSCAMLSETDLETEHARKQPGKELTVTSALELLI